MYDFNKYDNDLAYSYDDYIGYEENDTQEQDEFDYLQYESKMAEQMIDDLYEIEDN